MEDLHYHLVAVSKAVFISGHRSNLGHIYVNIRQASLPSHSQSSVSGKYLYRLFLILCTMAKYPTLRIFQMVN